MYQERYTVHFAHLECPQDSENFQYFAKAWLFFDDLQDDPSIYAAMIVDNTTGEILDEFDRKN